MRWHDADRSAFLLPLGFVLFLIADGRPAMTPEAVKALAEALHEAGIDCNPVAKTDGPYGVPLEQHNRASKHDDSAESLAAALAARGWTLEPEGLREALDRIERDAEETTEYPRYQPDEDFDDGWNAVRSRWINSVRKAIAALSTTAAPSGEGHRFASADPEAKCPTCSFPAWTHDPATAYLYTRTLAAPTPPTPTAAGLDPLAWRPPTPKRVPMNVHPDAREAVHQLLMNDPRFHGVGYSQFVMWSAALARSGQEEPK